MLENFSFSTVVLVVALLLNVIFIVKTHSKSACYISILLWCFIFSIILSISSGMMYSINFTSFIFIIFMLLHRLKLHYYKQPLLATDFIIAADVKNWETIFHYKLLIVSMLGILGLFIYAMLSFWGDTYYFLNHFLGIGLAILFFYLINQYSEKKYVHRLWMKDFPECKDVYFNIVMSWRSLFFKAPQYNDSSAVFIKDLPKKASISINKIKPDIVVWLQESTFNPINYAIDIQNRPTINMFQPNDMSVFTSYVRVPTFGGGTWKSEFAFLTGVEPNHFGVLENAVFYSVVSHIKMGLVQNLHDQGYFCVALTPFTKTNYNAKFAYDHLGFDLILQPQELGYPAPITKNLWDISSEYMASCAHKIMNKGHPKLKDISQPIFLYLLTMKEHGPYDKKAQNDYHIKNEGMPSGLIGQLNDYIHRITLLDKAMMKFEQVMMDRDRPFVLGYFGDHQPHFDYHIDYNLKYAKPDYITQCQIKTNIPFADKQQGGCIYLSQLGGVILEVAGVQPNDFFHANIFWRKKRVELDDEQRKAFDLSYYHYIYHDLNILK
ncbi:sulfatase-like hydrolase/transferase [Pasteurellaceae bacterium HPA106]|uniref:sulfatase-like hydrolase/transferase n=1 Tax=Spirabiliibacterium pneumoniae TaxID=221400 RepID=UPI001AACEAC2|nr:sulfatase-like hydrolase/transferase [Spirabiliibacterium pneumoniae]MBE2896837.1 sulfatase-like hydrolase/transferase [Spirabiliibacterium pneumoniae]